MVCNFDVPMLILVFRTTPSVFCVVMTKCQCMCDIFGPNACICDDKEDHEAFSCILMCF